MKFPSREQIERLRKRYPARTRIELIEMSDSQAPPSGTLGTCIAIDDMGDLIMRWDNGSGLNLVPEVDDFRIVKEAHHE